MIFKSSPGAVISFAIFGVIASSFAMPIIQATSSSEIVDIVVVDKDRITTGSGDSMSSKYLIFTETETFENTDSLTRWKFNSSDIQGKLLVGNAYQVEVYGYRIPFLSQYRNIVDVETVYQSQLREQKSK